MQIEKIEFPSGPGRCAGDLYLPDNGGSGQPAIVIGHGFSFVKEALGEEGKRFSEAGFVTLAIDYRSFGESPGEPRGQLFPLNHICLDRHLPATSDPRWPVHRSTSSWGPSLQSPPPTRILGHSPSGPFLPLTGLRRTA